MFLYHLTHRVVFIRKVTFKHIKSSRPIYEFYASKLNYFSGKSYLPVHTNDSIAPLGVARNMCLIEKQCFYYVYIIFPAVSDLVRVMSTAININQLY